MSSTALGALAWAVLATFALAVALPRITPSGDARPDAYWAPSSQPADVRAEDRSALAARSTFRRESLGWRYSAPSRSLLFRPCRSADGRAVDTDMDGRVDNLTTEDRWKKDWAVHNPAVADPLWSTRTPDQRRTALELARRQMGLASDFGRENEPPDADCDQDRGAVSSGPYYWQN